MPRSYSGSHRGATWARRPLSHVVIVGAGPAATAAVEELRALGFPGTVTVLGGEPTGPYDRTACSKGLVDGRHRAADVALPMTGGARWRLGERAVHLDPEGHVVTGESGDRYHYDGLIIATGGRVEVPSGWPTRDPGVYPLRTLADALAIRRALRGADRVAIVGGGLSGCELACSMMHTAREVVIVEANPTLLYRSVGEQMGALITKEHRDRGIELRLGRTVEGIRRRRGQFQLGLDDGDTVCADLVVLATGETPETGWLEGCGYDLRDGVRCDELLRVVGGDGTVVAAGAVASWPNLRYDTPPGRCGHWVSALEQGAAAARTLLAGDELVPPVTLVPRYSSQQDRLRVQVAGDTDAGTEVRFVRLRRRGLHGPARGGVLATYHRGRSVVAVAAVNASRAFAETVRDELSVLPDPCPTVPLTASDRDLAGVTG